MELTIGEIATAVALFAGLITGGGVIVKQVRKMFEPLRMDICINFIIRFMDVVESGQHVGELARQRFHEQYDYYTQHGGNSYIKEKYNSLHERGLL